MYAVVVGGNGVYDVISLFNHIREDVVNNLDTAYATGLPITSIDASAHKQSALYGATFDGSAFSGGVSGPNLLKATQEELDSFNLYAFLSDSVVVARIAVPVDSPKAEMFSAANATGMSLIKVPEDQAVYVGQSYNWDGTSFSSVE